ncbi:MAG: type II secretion system GspH family protein [Lentisphaerales bacterium]|nr:type II secretion system GspH family protein [Lentisphaerales bacterium]
MGVRNKFTLIELMVVISVIGVLMTLLLPSLRKAREASMSSVCKNNLKQIFIAESSYISNWGGRITPANVGFSSYDDLLSSYMGRDMTEDQLQENKLSKNNDADAAINNQILQCPDDNTAREYENRIPRSYSGNGRQSGIKDSTVHERDGDSYGPMRNKWSPFAGQLLDSSGTISFTEYHGTDNYAGRQQKAAMDNANELISTNNSNQADGYEWATPHGKYLYYNFAYWDGHVVTKNVNTTFNQAGGPSGKEWSMDPDD